jgi:hypothetical protein
MNTIEIHQRTGEMQKKTLESLVGRREKGRKDERKRGSSSGTGLKRRTGY